MSFRDKYYDYRKKFQYENWNNVQLTSDLRLIHNDLTINLTPEWSIRFDDYRNMRQGGTFGKPTIKVLILPIRRNVTAL